MSKRSSRRPQSPPPLHPLLLPHPAPFRAFLQAYYAWYPAPLRRFIERRSPRIMDVTSYLLTFIFLMGLHVLVTPEATLLHSPVRLSLLLGTTLILLILSPFFLLQLFSPAAMEKGLARLQEQERAKKELRTFFRGPR